MRNGAHRPLEPPGQGPLCARCRKERGGRVQDVSITGGGGVSG